MCLWQKISIICIDVNIVIFIMLYVKLVCTEWKYNRSRWHWNFVLIIVKDFKPIPAEWCLVLCFWLRIDFFTEMFYVFPPFVTSHLCPSFVYMYPECTCDLCGNSFPYNPAVAISSAALIDIGRYFVYFEGWATSHALIWIKTALNQYVTGQLNKHLI